ncbi:alpha/beta fold hydrolase [Paractinoplanes globisporus]|uniref:Alpha/beta fold hydrolase n=1 Tax=Paractinoplanes globisporus TaxID=113565 RepID=A0ABW6WFI2_9ACTN|nr:alpha/beta hydrolase [Actinoplanes globisporus]
MGQVTSRDGTSIAYGRQGEGPPLILVGGGITDRSENAPLAAELAAHFTVYNYDRRGRGLSGDAPRYAVQREIEDIEALLVVAGGSAHLYGVSSGGALLLEAAAAGLPGINGLAVYEVPYDMADDWPHLWRDYVGQLETALAENRRGDAFELFMRLAGSSDEEITGARNSPMWPGLEAIAHTLAYDAACLGNGQPPIARFANITQPTLVAAGGTWMPGSARWIRALDPAADAIAAGIPGARRQIIAGQSHVADPKVMTAVLKDFFHH